MSATPNLDDSASSTTSARDESGAPLIPAAQALHFLPNCEPFTSWKGNVRIADVLGHREAYRLEGVGLLDNELWAESEPSRNLVSSLAPHRIRIGAEEFRSHFRTRNPHRMKPIGDYSWLLRMRDELVEKEKRLDDLLEQQPVSFEDPVLAPLLRKKLVSLRGHGAVGHPTILHFVNRLVHAPVAVSGTSERLFASFDLGRGWSTRLSITEYVGESIQPLENRSQSPTRVEVDGGDLRVQGILFETSLLAGVLRAGE